jgi:hypothetical protein
MESVASWASNVGNTENRRVQQKNEAETMRPSQRLNRKDYINVGSR